MNAYMWNLKNSGIEGLIYKAEIETQMQRTMDGYHRGKGCDELGDWD